MFAKWKKMMLKYCSNIPRTVFLHEYLTSKPDHIYVIDIFIIYVLLFCFLQFMI